MTHETYIRAVPGSRDAVVLIHGIAGTPRHFDFLIPLIPESWNIYNLLLPGHGSDVHAFGKSSMEQWKQYVSDALDTICAQSDRVIVVGHSMGTLFAIDNAISRPQIQKLFLLAVPLCPFVRPKTMAASVALATGGKGNKTANAMKNASSVTLTTRFWEYGTWTPRLLELLRECDRIKKLLPHLSCPTVAFQSRYDELVAYRSKEYLAQNPYITCITLYGSGHFVYYPHDKEQIMAHFEAIFRDT